MVPGILPDRPRQLDRSTPTLLSASLVLSLQGSGAVSASLLSIPSIVPASDCRLATRWLATRRLAMYRLQMRLPQMHRLAIKPLGRCARWRCALQRAGLQLVGESRVAAAHREVSSDAPPELPVKAGLSPSHTCALHLCYHLDSHRRGLRRSTRLKRLSTEAMTS